MFNMFDIPEEPVAVEEDLPMERLITVQKVITVQKARGFQEPSMSVEEAPPYVLTPPGNVTRPYVLSPPGNYPPPMVVTPEDSLRTIKSVIPVTIPKAEPFPDNWEPNWKMLSDLDMIQ